jgi:hypothetical protein
MRSLAESSLPRWPFNLAQGKEARGQSQPEHSRKEKRQPKPSDWRFFVQGVQAS